MWGIGGEQVQHWLFEDKPAVHISGEGMQVGAASLLFASIGGVGGTKMKASLSHTRVSLQVMEGVLHAIAMAEPVLLVGETGTGKTSVVQHLSRVCGQTLVVHNLSQQSESADLLGGFKPVQVSIAVQE